MEPNQKHSPPQRVHTFASDLPFSVFLLSLLNLLFLFLCFICVSAVRAETCRVRFQGTRLAANTTGSKQNDPFYVFNGTRSNLSSLSQMATVMVL